MKYLNLTELRSKDQPDLQKHLHALRDELKQQAFDNRSKAPQDAHATRKLKTQIAQTLSVINEQPTPKKVKEEK